jgi:Toprim domain
VLRGLSTMADLYVRTEALKQAARGQEMAMLRALGIPWEDGARHISCPYPDHLDRNPSWRWDTRKAKAFCTCITQRGGHSILEIVKRVKRIDFEAAKLRTAEILGRRDLIETKGGQRMDAASLLRPPHDQGDDSLGRGYLAYRLGVPPEAVPMPSTAVVGWRSLAYYDPPTSREKKPRLVGCHPCVVFATAAPDGRRHAHRIYVASGGRGKAELGSGSDGRPRDPKKSARLKEGQSATGCVVFWGEPATAHRLLVAEGIETAAAIALAHRAEIDSHEVVVAAALSAAGIRSFQPWPATRTITVAADRDEARSIDDRGYRAGEHAARAFALAHHERVEIKIALPGRPGEDVDWLDVLRRSGPEAVRTAIAAAPLFEPAAGEKARDTDASSVTSGDEAVLSDLAARAAADPSVPFERDTLSALATARRDDPPGYQRTIGQLKQAGVRMRDLEREVRRAGLRVIEGGATSASIDPVVEAGPYFVTRDGMIAWRKETREGVVPQVLCNFTARIVAEEVLDDGAEQRTVFVIEGELPGHRPLPPTRVPAERYPAINWVTEAWGTAPVIFAGQGKRDHLRAAIQMLSGSVPRRTIYGHFGWRRIGNRWAYLHSGGAIGSEGTIEDVEVDTSTDGLLSCQLPLPEGAALADAVRASLALLDLGPDTITAAVLGATYRAPLGEPSPIDFALHLAGPTGAFKTELAALAQAHFGAAFNGRHLPASWADTANMLEKKAFLAKDALLVVDDFAPTGTTTDVQRLHREADRLFRAAGNRAGRARMRADGGSRPTYYPRGMLISTGEEIPSGQSLRARLLVLELTPGDITAVALSSAQAAATNGLLAAAMAGYLCWLASRIDDLKAALPERRRTLRDTLAQAIDHRRTPDIAASLILGWETFLRFAEDVGAISCAVAASLLARVHAGVTDSTEVQRTHQAGEEPARRFLALLAAAISSGRAHLADADNGIHPKDAASWGWQFHAVDSGQDAREVWRPNGERLGWIRDADLLLEPETAFAAAQKLARDQGTSIPVKQRTLWKRLAEQGLLASRDRARGTNTVRHTIEGLRRDLLHLRASVLAAKTDHRGEETDQHDATDQEKAPESRGFPGRGQFGQFGQKTEHRGRDERDLRDAVGWEIEI